MSNEWAAYEDGASWATNETEVEVFGDVLFVTHEQGSGYSREKTTATIPLHILAQVLRRAGYGVTATSSEGCVACNELIRNHRRSLEYAQRNPSVPNDVYERMLAKHRAEVHGEVTS